MKRKIAYCKSKVFLLRRNCWSQGRDIQCPGSAMICSLILRQEGCGYFAAGHGSKTSRARVETLIPSSPLGASYNHHTTAVQEKQSKHATRIPPLTLLLRMSLCVKFQDYPFRIYELADHKHKALCQQILVLHWWTAGNRSSTGRPKTKLSCNAMAVPFVSEVTPTVL